MSSELMDTEQVALLLTVPQATLRWWRHVGDKGPRSFRIGRGVRYKRHDVEDWLRKQYETTSSGG